MKYIRRLTFVLLLESMVNYIPVLTCIYFLRNTQPQSFRLIYFLLFMAVFVFINLHPLPQTTSVRRIQRLAEGCELLTLFAITFALSLVFQVIWLRFLFTVAGGWTVVTAILEDLVLLILSLCILFWNGMKRNWNWMKFVPKVRFAKQSIRF